MPLSMLKTGVSAVYGIADIGAEYADSKMALTKPFQNVTDLSRAGATVAGVVIQEVMRSTRMNDVGEALTLSAVPLLEKSVFNAVLSLTGTSTFRAHPRGQILVKRPGSVPGAAGNVPGVVY